MGGHEDNAEHDVQARWSGVTKQLDLFDVQRLFPHGGPRFTAPARAGSEPQQEAARLVAPYACKQAREVLCVLIEHGPMIQEEIAARGFRLSSVNARMNRLWELGFVKIIGRRPGSSGVRAHLYAATETGIEWWKEKR